MLNEKNSTKTPELYSRSDIRNSQRYITRRLCLVMFISIITTILLVLSMARVIFPTESLNATKVLPANTTDIQIFNPMVAYNNPESANRLRKVMDFNAANSEASYLNDFATSVDDTFTLQKKQSWLQGSFVKAKTPDGNIEAYKISSSRSAKEFMLSPSCKTSFLKNFCDVSKFKLKNKWLIVSSPEIIDNYDAKIKTPLSKNETFKAQTGVSFDKSIVSIWTTANNITTLLPLQFGNFLPSDIKTSLEVKTPAQGLTISGSFYKGDSQSDFFNKNLISDSITKTPANTTMAISVAGADSSVTNMLKAKDSFINTESEWKQLRAALESYGLVVPDDLKDILGTTSTFSMNAGTVGNKVAGTLRITHANKDKVVEILTNASAQNKTILDMYTLKEDSDDLVIESHTPITDGELGDSPQFKSVIKDISSSVALAYIDIDKNNKLIDSTYVMPEQADSNGTLGVNISKVNSQELAYTINWSFLDR